MLDENLLRAFASLIACVGVLFLVYLFIKRYAVKRNNSSAANGESLSVISRMPLPPKGMLSVVAIGRRRFLIGSTEHNISLVADITESGAAPNETRNASIEANLPAPIAKIPTNTVKIPPADFEDDDSASFSTFLKTVLSRESTRK